MVKRALIIDDNRLNVDVLVHLLKGQGIDSQAVLHPRNLAAVLEEEVDYQVIFLDLEMPFMDGFEVLARLKSDGRFAGVPIVAYTVHVSEIHVAHDHGFDGFLGKPLDSDRFPEQLERILNGESVWEAS